MLDSATGIDGAIQVRDSMRFILLQPLMLRRARDISEPEPQDARTWTAPMLPMSSRAGFNDQVSSGKKAP